jgi:hypothetical protein
MVRRVAVGMSTVTKSTPFSIRLAMNATLRGEPVEASNEKHGALAAFRKGGLELRPVGVASAALGLGERGDRLAGVGKVARHGLALCVET